MLRQAITGMAAFLLLFGFQSFAAAQQLASPSLTARIGGVNDDDSKSPELKISNLDIAMRLEGQLAEITLTVQFANPTDDDVEGEFALALPTGAIVTGYALDIDDVMVDGVLANQSRARKTYEDRVRDGIDPGLAEVTRDNRFKTRIFPIRAGKGRTIRIRMALPLGTDGKFAVPLLSTERVSNLKITVAAHGVETQPELLLPAGIQLAWVGGKGDWRGEAVARDVLLSGELGMVSRDDAKRDDIALSRDINGDHFIQLVGNIEGVKGPAPTKSQRVRVYWDSSRSHDDDANKQEAQLVSKIVAANGGQVDLVTFSSGKPVVQTLASVSALEQALNSIPYRGGTSLTGLDALALDPAGLCLLVGDGGITIDKQAAFEPDCVVHAINAQRAADAARLGRLSARGQFIKLDAASDLDSIAERLSAAQGSIASIRDGRGRPLAYRMLYNDGSRYALVAKLSGNDDGGVVKVTLAGGGMPNHATEFSFGDMRASDDDLAAQYWASDRIAAIADDPAQTKALEEMSRRYSIASPQMAFVVFEVPGDYLEADVAPPASYPKAKRAEYAEAKADQDKNKEGVRKERMAYVIEQWDERKAWWATDFNPNAGPGKNNRSRRNSDGIVEAEPSSPPLPYVAPAPSEAAADAAAEEDDDQAIVVTSSRRTAQAPPMQMPEPDTGKIEVETVFADRPYLNALDKADAANRLSVLAQQEKEFGLAPAFYLDTALWFATKGDKAVAIDLLLSALELPESNAETELIVANRLLRWGEMDRAVEIFAWLEAQTQGRPQPKRSFALALAERAGTRSDAQARADLEKAIRLLEQVVLEPANEAYDGLELVALMDANAMVARLQKAGGTSPLDKALTALLDLDIRVVIEWTNDGADIDLWVDEPNGERAIYSNPKTAIGGQISNDMTRGFGPEEYVLRRAPKGKFVIRTNSYSGDRINPNGASRVIVRLYRNFGRANETMELLDVELSEKEGEESRMIATITARQ